MFTSTITPSKTPLAPGTGNINNVDVIAVQRHFLGIAVIPTGCRRTAADANINGLINNQDVIAVQRFFLGFTSGISSVGQYKFAPTSTTYSNITSSQVTDYAAYVVGDTAAAFVNRPNDGLPDALKPEDEEN